MEGTGSWVLGREWSSNCFLIIRRYDDLLLLADQRTDGPSPTARQYAAAAVSNAPDGSGRLLVFGGTTVGMGLRSVSSVGLHSSFHASRLWYRSHDEDGPYISRPYPTLVPFPRSRQGGWQSGTSLNDLWSLNLTSGNWTQAPVRQTGLYPSARLNAAAVAVAGDFLLVYGGAWLGGFRV